MEELSVPSVFVQPNERTLDVLERCGLFESMSDVRRSLKAGAVRVGAYGNYERVGDNIKPSYMREPDRMMPHNWCVLKVGKRCCYLMEIK